MEFFHRAAGQPQRLGIFPGTFNPVTIAHLELARAGLSRLDEVVFVLPRVFPHKTFDGASFDARVEMLGMAVGPATAFSVAASDHGLFIDIAAECRELYGPQSSLTFLCGRDAAERIAGWDYGRPGVFDEMLREFELLVAHRAGEYLPPAHLRTAIHTVRLSDHVETVSATEVRSRIARGERWEHLVPDPIRDQVRRLYGATAPGPAGI